MQWFNTVRKRRAMVARPAKRSLQLESLESRLVLSGVSVVSAVAGDGPQKLGPTTVSDAPAVSQDSESGTFAQAELADGLLQVPVNETHTEVMIRQFIDYRVRPVVEVQTADHWLAFPVEQVRQIEIDARSPAVQIAVEPSVTRPVQVVNPENADLVFMEGSVEMGHVKTSDETLVKSVHLGDFAMPSVADNVMTGNVLVAEGEDPGGSGTPGQLAPTITSFANETQFGFRRFYGTVIDDEPVEGLVVHFGGVIDGETATVNADGTFELIISLPPGTTGTATAQTTDADGLDSNVASTEVS